MKASLGFNRNMSLESWLFGDENGENPMPQSHQSQRTIAIHKIPSNSGKDQSATWGSASLPTTPSRATSLLYGPRTSVAPTASSANATPRSKQSTLSFPLPTSRKATPNGTPTNSQKSIPSQLHTELFPVSSKLRRLFRPTHPSWTISKIKRYTPEEKHQELLGLTTASFERLQGHVPFTLKEIVKDPKKLPYLLQWLSVDDEEGAESTIKTNYHQVVLFLLEVEQLQLVPEDKRQEQAFKIWNKYIDVSSEFQISSTLELTTELMQLVRDSIDSSVLDSFFPIQKLAYMRLTREELPRFLKSQEYIQMLVDTENDPEAVPMERILEQPRAAHYFLLFLMQSRQHFELYFWLHVEYVLKPLVDQSIDSFWHFSRVLMKKAIRDSQAITIATKNDLYQSIEDKNLPVATAFFHKAQQEIFVMLRSSWFDRFMKSNLYKVALNDSLFHLQRKDVSVDSPPKLLNRTFVTLEEASLRLLDKSGEHSHLGLNGLENELSLDVDSEDISEASSSSIPSEDEHEVHDFSKMALDLEKIIRLTKLPDGLQVHYRPHYDATTVSPGEGNELLSIQMICTFTTTIQDGIATLDVQPIVNSRVNLAMQDISRRIKAFLVPDDRVLIKSSDPPPDILFAFQQSGRNDFLYGCVYRTYALVQQVYVAKGICILSRFPLVQTLRSILEQHVRTHLKTPEVFSHDILSTMYADDTPVQQLELVSCMPFQFMQQQRARSESSLVHLLCGTLDSRVDISVKILFDQFGSAMALQILACALLECSVVLVASQYSLLTMCAEAVRCLLRPFSWCHVYAPVLPKSLLSYLQCPTPIFVGLHSSYAARADLPSNGFYAIADMDRKLVEFGSEQTIGWRRLGLQETRTDRILLPAAFEQAKAKVDDVLNNTAQYDCVYNTMTSSLVHRDNYDIEQQLRVICYELVSSLLDRHMDASLVVGDTTESVVIFDETQFLASRPLEDVLFYQALLRTQGFSEVVSSHRIDISSNYDLPVLNEVAIATTHLESDTVVHSIKAVLTP